MSPEKLNMTALYRLMRSFGIKSGFEVFLNFRLDKLNNIRIPSIKTPILLRSATSDIPLFNQIFVNKEYNIKFAQSPKVIIDAGANIGLFTVSIKNQFPEAKVICIEPHPGNFQALKQNVSFYEDVFCENCGLWNKETLLKVYDKYNIGNWAMVVEENNEEGNIKATTINKLMDTYSLERIDILKLDIETSEREVFFENYDNWLSKTKMIIIELHDWMRADCSKPFFEAINKTFKKYTYSVSGENTIIINNDME
jgi:FkbM family methyltransferase